MQLKGEEKRRGGVERRKFLHHLVLVTCQVVYGVSKAVLFERSGMVWPQKAIGKRRQGVCHSALERVCYIVLIFCMHD